jgi:hypothetical protein
MKACIWIILAEAGQGKDDKPLERCHGRAAQALADDQRCPATGATSISRKKPNSRSQTMEPAEKSAVNSTDIASTPAPGQPGKAGAEDEQE